MEMQLIEIRIGNIIDNENAQEDALAKKKNICGPALIKNLKERKLIN